MFLQFHHRRETSLSTVKRRLKKLNLLGRHLAGIRVDAVTLNVLVWDEMCGSGSNIGESSYHLRRRGILARQSDVRLAILAYDSEGVSRRRRS